MLAGLWRHSEVVQDVYTILDLVEVNRVLDVNDENRRRAAEAARQQAQQR